MLNQRSQSFNSVDKPPSVSFKIPGEVSDIAIAETLKRRFWWFAVVASLNHALNYVVTSYATSLLGKIAPMTNDSLDLTRLDLT